MKATPQKGDLIFGRHPVLEALEAGLPIDKLWLQQGVRGEYEKSIRHWSRQRDIPMQVVPKEKLGKLVGAQNHQGIVGFLSIIEYQALEDILPLAFEQSETPLLVLLDGVTDVRNLGAIARSAECCGAHALVIPKRGGALVNAEAIKASAGALNRIPVCRVNSLNNTIEYLQGSGLQLLASDLQATKMLFEVDLRGPIALLLGAEGEGVSPAVLAKANETFRIPQVGQTDSFNVSVAAGIMLYECLRQRMGDAF